MATINRFGDLEAWKIARIVTNEIYRVSRNGVFKEDYGLRNQICRAAVSIMSNIAEGFERDGNKEFVNFLSIAKDSAGEARTQLYVALDQNYITKTEFDFIYQKVTENSRIISGLIKYLKQTELKGNKYK